MTLEQIFKGNPELLNDETVKKLIDYVQNQHTKSVEILKRKQMFYDKVFDKLMHSEMILIGGTDAKETLRQINELILEY